MVVWRKAVSGFPAPPLRISGLGGKGSEHLGLLTRGGGTATIPPIPRTLKPGTLVAENTRPPLDRARRKINGWWGLQYGVQLWERDPPNI